MGDMADLWGYEENQDMEQLGQKLLFTTLELEKLKAEAAEEIKKNKEYMKHLLHLLKHAIQERDEARTHLQNLLSNNNMNINSNSLPKPGKANSSVTESNSLSETYNYHSPVESLFDGRVSSPPEILNNQFDPPKVDQASLVIDTLVKGRVLPPKGRLLQTVIQTGPLLQTLLVAGPLPRWRNPPQFEPFQIPPLSIGGFEGKMGPRSLVSQAFGQVASPSPMLSFGNIGSRAPNNSFCYAPLAKRQRFS